jgi:hypothetical protein
MRGIERQADYYAASPALADAPVREASDLPDISEVSDLLGGRSIQAGTMARDEE